MATVAIGQGHLHPCHCLVVLTMSMQRPVLSQFTHVPYKFTSSLLMRMGALIMPLVCEHEC